MRTGPRWTCSGFDVVERAGARVLVRPEAAPWVRRVLEGGQGLYAASARVRGGFRVEGRNPVFVIPTSVPNGAAGDPDARWAVRHYTRGGPFMSNLLQDRYLLSLGVRPYHETQASEEARRRGIPTPRVVAAAMYPRGLLYRGDLVTEFIPQAVELVDALFDTSRKGAGGATERLDALRSAGELVKALARAGLRHRDLHAGNILLEWHGAAPQPYLLDLDRCEVGREGTAISPTSMHQRLRRSLMKWERRTQLRISEREWQTLEEAVFR